MVQKRVARGQIQQFSLPTLKPPLRGFGQIFLVQAFIEVGQDGSLFESQFHPGAVGGGRGLPRLNGFPSQRLDSVGAGAADIDRGIERVVAVRRDDFRCGLNRPGERRRGMVRHKGRFEQQQFIQLNAFSENLRLIDDDG